jgi:hypothetical protein
MVNNSVFDLLKSKRNYGCTKSRVRQVKAYIYSTTWPNAAVSIFVHSVKIIICFQAELNKMLMTLKVLQEKNAASGTNM